MKRKPTCKKRKSSAPQMTPQALRRRYTWHLRSPFKEKFDHSHWWEGPFEIQPIAALYELARRHPLVGERWLAGATVLESNSNTLPGFIHAMTDKTMRASTDARPVPYSLQSTCLLGLHSWAQLDYTARKNWARSSNGMKGLDFRTDFSQCQSITRLAHWDIIAERKEALRKNGKLIQLPSTSPNKKQEAAEKKNLTTLHKHLVANPPTAEEWESAIAYRAVEAYRQGSLLLAVAPDLKAKTAAEVMGKVYGSTRRSYARPKQRARWQNWLPLIAAFENAEKSPQGAYAQDFVHYRRVLDAIRFT